MWTVLLKPGEASLWSYVLAIAQTRHQTLWNIYESGAEGGSEIYTWLRRPLRQLG